MSINDINVLGRRVGIAGVAEGIIIAAGWGYKLAVTRATASGRTYQTLVPGYVVRWDWGKVSAPRAFDLLEASDFLDLRSRGDVQTPARGLARIDARQAAE